MLRNMGLAVFLGLALSVGAVAEDGLKEPKVDRPEKSEIEYWDSVIDRTTQPNTDGPLTDAQRKSYLENDTDQLDPATTRLQPVPLPKARLSTERGGLGQLLP